MEERLRKLKPIHEYCTPLKMLIGVWPSAENDIIATTTTA